MLLLQALQIILYRVCCSNPKQFHVKAFPPTQVLRLLTASHCPKWPHVPSAQIVLAPRWQVVQVPTSPSVPRGKLSRCPHDPSGHMSLVPSCQGAYVSLLPSDPGAHLSNCPHVPSA